MKMIKKLLRNAFSSHSFFGSASQQLFPVLRYQKNSLQKEIQRRWIRNAEFKIYFKVNTPFTLSMTTAMTTISCSQLLSVAFTGSRGHFLGFSLALHVSHWFSKSHGLSWLSVILLDCHWLFLFSLITNRFQWLSRYHRASCNDLIPQK